MIIFICSSLVGSLALAAGPPVRCRLRAATEMGWFSPTSLWWSRVRLHISGEQDEQEEVEQVEVEQVEVEEVDVDHNFFLHHPDSRRHYYANFPELDSTADIATFFCSRKLGKLAVAGPSKVGPVLGKVHQPACALYARGCPVDTLG